MKLVIITMSVDDPPAMSCDVVPGARNIAEDVKMDDFKQNQPNRQKGCEHR